MSNAVTGEKVKAFWKYMSKKYDFEIVNKEDSRLMKAVSGALGKMGVLDKDAFMQRFTTTISVAGKNVIYVPFEIGAGTRSQLVKQIAVCVHEAQHVVQASRDPLFPIKYLGSDVARAHYEGDAYRATMEMKWYLTGKMPSPHELAELLSNYSIGPADRRVVEKHLVIAEKVIKAGGVITGPSKVAIRWLGKNGIGSAAAQPVEEIRVR